VQGKTCVFASKVSVGVFYAPCICVIVMAWTRMRDPPLAFTYNYLKLKNSCLIKFNVMEIFLKFYVQNRVFDEMFMFFAPSHNTFWWRLLFFVYSICCIIAIAALFDIFI
jgi:hypothetical protein